MVILTGIYLFLIGVYVILIESVKSIYSERGLLIGPMATCFTHTYHVFFIILSGMVAGFTLRFDGGAGGWKRILRLVMIVGVFLFILLAYYFSYVQPS